MLAVHMLITEAKLYLGAEQHGQGEEPANDGVAPHSSHDAQGRSPGAARCLLADVRGGIIACQQQPQHREPCCTSAQVVQLQAQHHAAADMP